MLARIVFLILLGSALLAQTQSQSVEACRCASSSSDEFEIPYSFPSGPYKDQCVDSCRFRYAEILHTKQYKNLKASGDEWLIANILHNEKFYVGLIPFSKFRKIEIGFEEFKTGIYHVFLRFPLEDSDSPLTLVSQNGNDKGDKPESSRGLVISSEGVPPKDQPYSLWEGFLGNYLISHRLTTSEESLRWTSKLKNPVHYHALNMDPEEVVKVLKAALEASHNERLSQNYRLFTNNCATSILRFLMMGRKKIEVSDWDRFEIALPVAGPIGTLPVLKKMGVLAPIPKLK